MRWFKHITHASRDEKIMRLIDKFGLEGYGLYWLILETISEQLDETNRTSVEFSIKNWRKITGISPKKFQLFVETCEELKIFSVKISEELILIDCPNLLKYRDEYSRKKEKKSVQTPDTCQDNVALEQKQNKNRKEEDNIYPPLPPFDAEQIDLPECVDREDWLKWVRYLSKKKNILVDDTAKEQLRKLILWSKGGVSPGDAISYSIANGWKSLQCPEQKQKQQKKTMQQFGDDGLTDAMREFANE